MVITYVCVVGVGIHVHSYEDSFVRHGAFSDTRASISAKKLCSEGTQCGGADSMTLSLANRCLERSDIVEGYLDSRHVDAMPP